MSQVESKVNSCIQYILNSALFHWYDNDHTTKVRKYLSQAIKEKNIKKKIDFLIKASDKMMEMNTKMMEINIEANDQNIIQVSEQIRFLGTKLENNSTLTVSSFKNKFPFGCGN